MKFIRVHGKIVPLKGKGSAPEGVSKRYGAKRDIPKIKKIGVGVGAAFGAAMGAALPIAQQAAKLAVHGRASGSWKGLAKAGLIGMTAGAVVGSISHSNKGKGESNFQMSLRLSQKKK